MKDTDAFINAEVWDATNEIIDGDFLDSSYKIGDATEQEKMIVSKLWRMSDAMEKRDLAVICARTVRKYPMIYLHVLAEYIFELLKGRGKEK